MKTGALSLTTLVCFTHLKEELLTVLIGIDVINCRWHDMLSYWQRRRRTLRWLTVLFSIFLRWSVENIYIYIYILCVKTQNTSLHLQLPTACEDKTRPDPLFLRFRADFLSTELQLNGISCSASPRDRSLWVSVGFFFFFTTLIVCLPPTAHKNAPLLGNI